MCFGSLDFPEDDSGDLMLSTGLIIQNDGVEQCL